MRLTFQQKLCEPEESEWHDILKVMKRKNLQPRVLSKAFIHISWKDRKFYRQKLKEVSTIKTALKQMGLNENYQYALNLN